MTGLGRMEEVRALRDALEETIRAVIRGARLNGHRERRLHANRTPGPGAFSGVQRHEEIVERLGKGRVGRARTPETWRLNRGGTPNWFWGCHLA